MSSTSVSTEEMRQRTLLFLSRTDLWQFWPFLPVTRHKLGLEDGIGVVFDALHAINLPGHSCTVWVTNLFLMPSSRDEFFALPREVFDTPDELVHAGWTVD